MDGESPPESPPLRTAPRRAAPRRAEQAAGGGAGAPVPAAYRVARPADVRVRGVLAYVDAPPGAPAAPRRVPWLAALLAAYALWLLLVGLRR